MLTLQTVWRPAPNSRNTFLSLSSRPIFSLPKATFSTDADNKTQKASSHKPASSKQASGNPSYPSFSFKDLGANRTVKVVVIAGLSIIGTMESIFWAKVIWAKISPTPQEGPKPDGT
ncbi:hypothetical protein AOQ84DRAFT_354588 [Glonium stellatum]|uniref:Uncharacterized protein n=1 Tax=Glonium stellatum TaxID=574774 RepID=A0A8E2F1L7_9PEZI|nr:hypothetical protein AOQ84DRAFT_354588 [Glonium stellatum]